MKKKKILVLMEVLTDGERRHFLRWLKAELNGNQQIVFDLANFLIRHFPGFPKKEIIQNELHSKYPNIEQAYTKYTTILTQYIEYFITFRALKKNDDEREILLLQELNSRKAPDAYEIIARQIEHRMQTQPSSEAYYRKAWILGYANRTHRLKFGLKAQKTELSDIDQALDGWWLYQKIALLNTQLVDEYLFQKRTEFSQELIDNFEHWQKMRATYSPQVVFDIYEQLFLLLLGKEKMHADYLLLKLTDLKVNQQEIASNDLQNIFGLLLNYFIRAFNQGQENVKTQIFKLYEWGISHKTVYQGKYLSARHYRNFINICLRTKEEEKALIYLERYKKALSPKEQQSTYTLARANLHFRRKEFTAVVALFKDWKGSNAREKLLGRTFLVEAQYELEDMEPEEQIQQVENLIKFTHKQRQLSKNVKEPFLIRFRFLNRLLKASTPDHLDDLVDAIEHEPKLVNKIWMLEKIAEKKKRSSPN